jgi:hypothetical protein
MTANTGQPDAPAAMAKTTLASGVSPAQRWMRLTYRILGAGFVAGLLSQFFIVGLALFVDGGRWDLHRPVGHMLGLFPLTMLMLSFAARMTWPTRLLTALPVVLVIMQQVSVSIGGWAATLHPVNAVLLVGLGFHLLRRSTGNAAEQHLATR